MPTKLYRIKKRHHPFRVGINKRSSLKKGFVMVRQSSLERTPQPGYCRRNLFFPTIIHNHRTLNSIFYLRNTFQLGAGSYCCRNIFRKWIILLIVCLTWIPPRPPTSMLRITVLVVLCLRPFAGKYFASWETGHSQLWNWGCGGLALTLSNLTVFDPMLLSVCLHFYLRNTFRQLSAKLIFFMFSFATPSNNTSGQRFGCWREGQFFLSTSFGFPKFKLGVRGLPIIVGKNKFHLLTQGSKTGGAA